MYGITFGHSVLIRRGHENIRLCSHEFRHVQQYERYGSAIEAVIGHMKGDGRMDRCRLKGALGDALNAVLVAAGHNIRLLLRAMANLLRRILGRLLAASVLSVDNRDAAPTVAAAA